MHNFYIPETVELATLLPKSLEKYQDYAAFLIHRVASRNRDDYVTVNAAYIRKFFPAKTLYTKIKNILLGKGILECDAFYRKNEKSLGYKLGPSIQSKTFKKYQVKNKLLLKKLEQKDQLGDLLTRVKTILAKLEIPNVKSSHLTEHDVALNMIHDKDIFVYQDKYGRVHTNLTNLKSEHRSLLQVNGDKLVNIDIKNSQPLMLGLALVEGTSNNSIISSSFPSLSYTNRCPDLRDYVQLCEDGEFYDYLMAQTDFTGSRKAFKVSFFSSVFFCKHRKGDKNCALFSKLFPSIWDVICAIKKDDHTNLAKLLQRVESDFVINRVFKTCLTKFPENFVATIHDSLLVEPAIANDAKFIFENEFHKIGIHPSFSIEAY